MNRKSLILTAAALLLIIVGALVGYTYLSRGESAPQLSESAPQPAPDFTVYDAEGNEITLSALMDGKPTVLNFWASWCGPCRSEMPHIQEAYERLGGEVSFVMINMTDGQRETQESAEEYMAESGWTFPIYFDSDYDAAMTYGAYSLPQTYFIDAEGRLIAAARGSMSAVVLQSGIDMIT